MPRLPMLLGALLGALTAVLSLVPRAGAFVTFDFEQPYFLEDYGVQCKDHSVVKSDSLYHVFYIKSFPPNGHFMREENRFGHITSPDLRHWTRHPDVMSTDAPDAAAWESEFVWAPKVIEDPNSSDWLMYYTGATYNVTQQAGLASSSDLFNWYRSPSNPIYHPGSWAIWTSGLWANCRDPEIFHEDSTGNWYMLNTASKAPDSLGCVSYAISANLSNWTDRGALVLNDSNKVLESVQMVKHNGTYHLFFTEEGDGLISHMSSPAFATGWSKEDRIYVDDGHACEVTELPGEPTLWSRHRGIALRDGARFFFRFGTIDFDTPDGVPEVTHEAGFTPDWTVVFGNAFTWQPTWGDNPYERTGVHSGMEGNAYVGTYELFPNPNAYPPGRAQGNVPTGMVRSVDFTVTGDRMKLLVGGGDAPGLAFVGMVSGASGRLLFWETGTGGDLLTPRLWDLSTLAGQSVYLVIADLSSDADGNIATDSIEEYNRSGQDPQTPSTPMAAGPYLAQVLADAGFGQTGTSGTAAPAPARLLAPYPNPFNPRTRLRYELEAAGQVRLEILDAQGRSIRRLLDAPLSAGPGYVLWDGHDDRGALAASGVYLARLSVDGREAGRQKLLLVK
ncbi:MAG: hypothetical protein H6694_08765 [Candidatus Latescibacteria bacterium]|nr:hypothetical protein [Candidatus Latescibacterota bacterium]